MQEELIFMLNYTNGIELLSELHIKNRGLRLDMFTPVTPTNKPSVPDRQYVYEGVPDIVDGVAMQKWVIADKPLAQYQDEKKQAIEQAVQTMLDTEAQTAGYDNIISACSYATSTGSFGAEGQSFVDWRDSCWTMAFSIQQEVLAGTRVEPTVDEVLALMPTRVGAV